LPTFGAEVKAVADATFANATEVATNTTAAAGSASAAAASVATVGAVWVSGTTYAIGDMRYSPINFATYRRKTTGAGTTDPSLDATNWAPSAISAVPTPPGLVLIATLTPTAAANVDFLSAFTSTYDNYLIMVDGIGVATGTGNLRIRLANAGVVDTASNYTSNGTTGAASAVAALAPGVGVISGGKGVSGAFSIINANSASGLKTEYHSFTAQDTLTPTWSIDVATAGYFGGAVSGFRLYWAGGQNFTATGKVLVYGYSNT
jgi:hypothetical protein